MRWLSWFAHAAAVCCAVAGVVNTLAGHPVEGAVYAAATPAWLLVAGRS